MHALTSYIAHALAAAQRRILSHVAARFPLPCRLGGVVELEVLQQKPSLAELMPLVDTPGRSHAKVVKLMEKASTIAESSVAALVKDHKRLVEVRGFRWAFSLSLGRHLAGHSPLACCRFPAASATRARCARIASFSLQSARLAPNSSRGQFEKMLTNRDDFKSGRLMR